MIRFLLNKTIDVLLYVDRLDAYRVDTLDTQVVRAITDSFGRGIWKRSLIVLTHAQLSPPDGLSYEDFFSRRSEALLEVVRLGAGLRKKDMRVFYFTSYLFWSDLLYIGENGGNMVEVNLTGIVQKLTLEN